MHTVLVTGLIVTPLCAMAMVIADGWRSLRHPFDLNKAEPDRGTVANAGAGWRFAFWANRYLIARGKGHAVVHEHHSH